MLELLIQNCKGLLIQPVNTFERLKNTSLIDSYRHYVILLIFYSVLLGIISAMAALMSFFDMAMQFASIPILGSFFVSKIELFKPIFISWSLVIVYMVFLLMFVGIFFKGGFLHIFVILFGGEQGITRTLQVVMYAATPFFLLGWIPYISLIGLIWSFVLCVFGLRTLHNVSWWKAVAIIITPVIFLIIGVCVTLIIRAYLVTALSGIFYP